MYRLSILLCLTFMLSQLQAQTIVLSNSSFEDEPRSSYTPSGWYDCGKPGETPPDIQPSAFQVTKKAVDGNTYLGMVTRDNDTWEGVGQYLRTPLEADQCYDFDLYLARSDVYLSRTRVSEGLQQYTQPIKLRIWGGNSNCENKEMLDETKVVSHTTWRKYDFKLNPSRTYRYILIEVFYETPTLFAYNGNLLVDKCSAIVPCDEPEEPPIAIVDKTKKKQPKDKAPTKPTDTDKGADEDENGDLSKGDNGGVSTIPNPPEPKPEPSDETTFIPEEEIEVGKITRIDQLNFKADSFALNMDSYEVLDKIYEFLKKNKTITIEIGGHTNSIPPDDYCNELSENRAKAVADYLVEKGIPRERISYKGYGKTKPIATNKTTQGRRENQRVEIKIVSIDSK